MALSELGFGDLADAHMRALPRPRRVSTPVILKTGLAVILLAVSLMTATGLQAATRRSHAITDLRQRATPLLMNTEALYVALADADAAASSAFLQAGSESTELHARYVDDLDSAGRRVATVSGDLGSPANLGQTNEISAGLPSYAALVEEGRTNNRLDNPVGAAWQRRASEQMRVSLMPAATELYGAALQRFDADSRVGTDRSLQIALIIAASVAGMAIVVVQLLLIRRTRRLVNVGLAIATASMVVALVVVVDRLESQRSALIQSQQQGSDQLVAFSTVRILAMLSLSYANLDIIERGIEPVNRTEFDKTVAKVASKGTDDGILQIAERRAADPSVLAEIRGSWSAYLDAHHRVDESALSNGYYADATLAAVKARSAAADAVGHALDERIVIAREDLDRGLADAAVSLNLLRELLVAVSGVVALAASAGIWLRIREYR
jgi:hypothetical protein